MNLGIKLLIGGVSLATVSCGGYVIYTKVSGSNLEEKSSITSESDNSAPNKEVSGAQKSNTNK